MGLFLRFLCTAWGLSATLPVLHWLVWPCRAAPGLPQFAREWCGGVQHAVVRRASPYLKLTPIWRSSVEVLQVDDAEGALGLCLTFDLTRRRAVSAESSEHCAVLAAARLIIARVITSASTGDGAPRQQEEQVQNVMR